MTDRSFTGRLFAGIDAGSSATKCVVVDAAGEIVGHAVMSSGFDYALASQRVLADALPKGTSATQTSATQTSGAQASDTQTPDAQTLGGCVSTGYGRERVEFADRHVTEITCHARGARAWFPQVRHVIDIGGQDTKVIWVNAQGKMADYRMNAKCAAGTGTFVESVALRMGVPLSTIDELAMRSTHRTVVNSFCTVFAGTEVLERIKDGQPPEDICMGVFRSIATRVTEMMSAQTGPIAATGGVVAHSQAMVRALNEAFDTEVLLPPLPQHAGAYGAALLARASVMGDGNAGEGHASEGHAGKSGEVSATETGVEGSQRC